MSHAVYLKNQCPTKSHKYKKTSFKVKFDTQPDFSRIKIWGSRSYITKLYDKRTKDRDNKIQSVRGWLGYFVGYN